MSFRVGFGVDVHQLAENRKLVVGGVTIPHHKGVLGHSDADVLLHAICDALLGALALGDIGIHFPNTDPAFKDIDSRLLLEKCHQLITDKGYQVVNVDSSVCLESPKIKTYIPAMQACIASLLQIEPSCVSVKATTTERLGYVGREEGVTAYATVLLQKIPS